MQKPSATRLYRHFKKNQFWFWTAQDIYAIGIFFIIRVNFFDLQPPQGTLLGMLDDPGSIFLLAIAGTLVMTYSIWDFHWFYARNIVIMVSFFVFALFFGAFALHDYEMGNLSLDAVFTGAILCRITTYAFTGDD